MRWLVIMGLTLLSGCVSIPHAPTSAERPAHPESAPFAMNGRILIEYDGKRNSAGLHWTHRQQSDEILLLTPLGQTAARVYRDDGIATLDDGTKHYRDIDAASLMQQVLGWHLPLVGLHQWVLGLPDADAPAQIERNPDGRISLLRQDGWDVHYLSYTDTKPGSLPKRLRLKHDDMQVELLIDEWEWNPQ